MNNSYDAIYNAVRSRISSCDVHSAVESAVRQAFDISFFVSRIADEMTAAAIQAQETIARPHISIRPHIYEDGTMWCALYGNDIASGVCGFGETPAKACEAFDKAWVAGLTTDAQRAALAKARGESQ